MDNHHLVMDSLLLQGMDNRHHQLMGSLHPKIITHLPLLPSNKEGLPLLQSIKEVKTGHLANFVALIPITSLEEKLVVWQSLGDVVFSILLWFCVVCLALLMGVKIFSWSALSVKMLRVKFQLTAADLFVFLPLFFMFLFLINL
jgi:hypothetical protein